MGNSRQFNIKQFLSHKYLFLKLFSNRWCEDNAKYLVAEKSSQSRWIKMTTKAAELHVKTQGWIWARWDIKGKLNRCSKQ